MATLLQARTFIAPGKLEKRDNTAILSATPGLTGAEMYNKDPIAYI
jgi:hypothetical protein